MACLGMAPPRTLLPLLLLSSSVASTGQYVGPGPGAWEVGVPEQHGLDSKQLAAAAERVAEAVPYRRHALFRSHQGRQDHA